MKKKFLSALIYRIFNQTPISKCKKLRLGAFLGQLEIRSIRNSNTGFSVIEVILAAAIFVIFATAATGTVLQGISSNRLGKEQTIANQYAAEGLEAARSIGNQSYSYLVTTPATGVVRSASNVWTFGGTPNKTGNGKYTRVITIADVNRDGSGNIVAAPSGTLDPKTKKITSTVIWDFSPTRHNSVVLSTYLTNFRKPIVTQGGPLMYGDGTTTPKFRTYETSLSIDRFSKEINATTSASGNTFVIRTSPTKTEAIAGFVTSGGVLYVLCYNGETWNQEWTANVGGTGTTRKFDIAYETNSGKVMVAFSRNATATNTVDYRTKLGSTGCGIANWTVVASLPTSTVVTTGNVQWVKIVGDPRASSNIIAITWADINSDLGAAIWSGSAWSTTNLKLLETALVFVSAAQDVDSFGVTFESQTGYIMVVWGSGGNASTNGAWYNRCVGGTSACTWTAARTAITSMANDATNLDISSNPNTNDIVFASIGTAGSDLQAAYWSGSVWTGQNDLDTSAQTPAAGTHLVSTGWLISGATTRAVVIYANATNPTLVNARYLTVPNTWTPAAGIEPSAGNSTLFTPTPVFLNPQKWYEIEMDPTNKDRLMLSLSDNASDLFAKRLVMNATPAFTWTNSDGAVALETTLSQLINSPFSFAYWRNLLDQ